MDTQPATIKSTGSSKLATFPLYFEMTPAPITRTKR